MYIYIYIERERYRYRYIQRERDIDRYIYIYIERERDVGARELRGAAALVDAAGAEGLRMCNCMYVYLCIYIYICIRPHISGRDKGGPSEGGFLNHRLCSSYISIY